MTYTTENYIIQNNMDYLLWEYFSFCFSFDNKTLEQQNKQKTIIENI